MPINFRLVAAEIEYIVKHCEARAFIVQDDLLDRVEAIRDELGVVPGGFIHFGKERAPAGWQSYEALIGRASSSEPDVVVQPDRHVGADVHVRHDGQPKGAIRNHAGSALHLARHRARHGLRRATTRRFWSCRCATPTRSTSRSPSPTSAPTCVIDDRKSFDPEQLLRTLSERHVTFTSLVPTHYIMMLGLPGRREGASTTSTA